MKSWVAIDVAVRDNPKMRRFAAALPGPKRGHVARAVGHVAMLLGAIKLNAPSGALADIPDSLLEEWAAWDGRPGQFASTFRTYFAPDGQLHDWHEWNGRIIERQKREVERVQTWRDERVQNADGNGNVTRSRTRSVRGTYLPTLPTNQPPTPPPDQTPSSARASFLAAIPDDVRRHRWQAEIDSWTSGMGLDYRATEDDIDRALTDYLASEHPQGGPTFSPAHVRGFLKRAVAERESGWQMGTNGRGGKPTIGEQVYRNAKLAEAISTRPK